MRRGVDPGGKGCEGAGRWVRRTGGWRLHGSVLALLAAGAALGLMLWGKWGFLVAFDTIRAYCF